MGWGSMGWGQLLCMGWGSMGWGAKPPTTRASRRDARPSRGRGPPPTLPLRWPGLTGDASLASRRGWGRFPPPCTGCKAFLASLRDARTGCGGLCPFLHPKGCTARPHRCSAFLASLRDARTGCGGLCPPSHRTPHPIEPPRPPQPVHPEGMQGRASGAGGRFPPQLRCRGEGTSPNPFGDKGGKGGKGWKKGLKLIVMFQRRRKFYYEQSV